MSKQKGNEVEISPQDVPKLPPMKNPSAGSANPSVSFPALWGYLEPALDHIVRSSTNNPDKAPAIDVEYHMGIHTAVYNYVTSSRLDMTTVFNGSPDKQSEDKRTLHGMDLYHHLDKYFSDACQELLASAPPDDSSLIHYLIPCFNRYSAGGHSVNRLLNYVNRHYVKRAVEEDRGWLRLTDLLDVVTKTINEHGAREKIAKHLREKRLDELRKWGYTEGGSAELLSRAEAAAEAASPLDRIVPINSMAHRRFREEVMKPLLAIPKVKGKGKKRRIPNGETDANRENGPKSRLARAVKVLVESSDEDIARRRKLAADLTNVMGCVGIPMDHILRKKLEKFCEISLFKLKHPAGLTCIHYSFKSNGVQNGFEMIFSA